MKVILTNLIALTITSCGGVVSNDKTEKIVLNSNEGSATISSETESFAITANSDSAVEGAELVISPGSLAVGTSVSVNAATSIVNSSTEASLATSGLSIAGPAVYFESSGSSISVNPMSITIPLSGVISLNDKNVIVVYKTRNSKEAVTLNDNNFYLGIIPTKELTVLDKSVRFRTQRFGVYQVAFSENEITEAKEAETPIPISTAEPRDDFLLGMWQGECNVDADDNESRQFRLSIAEDLTYVEFDSTYEGVNCIATRLKRENMKRGTFVAGEIDSDNIRTLDIIPSRFYRSYHTTEEITPAIDDKHCNFTDWTIGMFKEITTTACVQEMEKKYYVYNS